MLTIVTWSVQPDGYMPRLPHRLHCRPNQMGMLTIATRLVQPDGHAYSCHTGYIVGLARWPCLQLAHRLHCRSSQMGTPTTATQATILVQLDRLVDSARRARLQLPHGLVNPAKRACLQLPHGLVGPARQICLLSHCWTSNDHCSF